MLVLKNFKKNKAATWQSWDNPSCRPKALRPYLSTGLPKKYLVVSKIIITLFNWKMLDFSSKISDFHRLLQSNQICSSPLQLVVKIEASCIIAISK